MVDKLTTSPKKDKHESDAERKLRWFSERNIRVYAFFSLALVLAYDFIKALHHARPVGIGESPDWELTGYLILEGLVGGIVTFALVWIAFSFERMDGLLGVQGSKSELLAQQFELTKQQLSTTQLELAKVQKDMLDVARTIGTAADLQHKLNSPDLLKIMETDPKLRADFMFGLDNLVGAWTLLVKQEFDNEYTNLNGTRYGLLCWAAALNTYLAEEAADISKRTVATNIGVYIKLIENIVDAILLKVKGTGTRVDLFASTNLLPAEFFNWREYEVGDRRKDVLGTRLSFMDDYRRKINRWLAGKDAPTITRVVLVYKPPPGAGAAQESRIKALGIQRLSQLRDQADSRILCNANDGEPKEFKFSELKDYYEDLEQSIFERHENEKAYAIGSRFSAGQLTKAHLSSRNLIEVFTERWHSRPADDHARYLRIGDEESVRHLEFLPKIPIERDALSCADFLAIRVKTDKTSNVIACIAAQLKPNLETMALHLITTREELTQLDQFIAYATKESRPVTKLNLEE